MTAAVVVFPRKQPEVSDYVFCDLMLQLTDVMRVFSKRGRRGAMERIVRAARKIADE